MAGQGGEEPGMAGQGGEEPVTMQGQCERRAPGVSCDDGDPCTENDVCDSTRECHGSPIFCDDGNECTVDSCDEGACVAEPIDDGTACGDSSEANCDGADLCIDGTCDENLGEDGTPCDDEDPDTGADVCSNLVCEGVPACADGTTEQNFAGNMVGCAGVVSWTERATLCGEGLSPCTAAQWVTRRGDAIPTHHYWTNTNLGWGGSAMLCTASTGDGSPCSGMEPSPMHVCAPAETTGTSSIDPEDNTCQWSNCGLNSSAPNQHFGGCGIPDPTAGTLCCW
jgi:hypothetical protein